MGQLNDIELCNNIVFLLRRSPESILSRCNDHFWCGLAEFILGDKDAASIRLEQIPNDDPSYLGGLVAQITLHKNSQKGTLRFPSKFLTHFCRKIEEIRY